MTIESARGFLFEHHQAYLGTVMDVSAETDGVASAQPYVSAVNTVASHDGCLLLQVSRLAVHSQNLVANNACSLLLMNPDSDDFQQSPRLSVQGVVRQVGSHLADRYLRLFPRSRAYLDLDFYCLAVDVKEVRWIEGFARAEWIAGADMGPLSTGGGTSAWCDDVERALVGQLTAEFGPALQRLTYGGCENDTDSRQGALDSLPASATRFGDVTLAALDPWGLWLLCDGRPQRLSFDLPVMNPSGIGPAVAEILGS